MRPVYCEFEYESLESQESTSTHEKPQKIPQKSEEPHKRRGRPRLKSKEKSLEKSNGVNGNMVKGKNMVKGRILVVNSVEKAPALGYREFLHIEKASNDVRVKVKKVKEIIIKNQKMQKKFQP